MSRTLTIVQHDNGALTLHDGEAAGVLTLGELIEALVERLHPEIKKPKTADWLRTPEHDLRWRGAPSFDHESSAPRCPSCGAELTVGTLLPGHIDGCADCIPF